MTSANFFRKKYVKCVKKKYYFSFFLLEINEYSKTIIKMKIWQSFSFGNFLVGFFNEKFRLIDWRWSVWRAASTIRLKFWLKFCFLTLAQIFLQMELIDIWNIHRYICKVLHKARIITLLHVLWKLSPFELG